MSCPSHSQTAQACPHSEHPHQSPNSAYAHHADSAHGGHSPLKTSAQATLHCLTGCVIGEVAGLAIAISLGFPIWATIALATTLAYISGFSLGLLPLVRQGHSFQSAFKLIWIGEAISIGVMEIAMNGMDYIAGGMHAGSILDPAFWIGLSVAIPAGFIAAWPVNWWLLSKNMKKCH